MRSFIAFLLFVTLMSSSVSASAQTAVCFYKAKPTKIRRQQAQPTRASKPDQRSAIRSARLSAVPGTFEATFAQVEATNVPDGGTKVEWRMETENANMGFLVYRVNADGKALVDDKLILGSAAVLRDHPLDGQQYSIVDPAGKPGDSYVVEAVGSNGASVSTDEVVSQPSESTSAARSSESASVAQPGVFDSTSPRLALSRGSKKRLIEVDDAKHAEVVNLPAAKIAVRKEGLYRVKLSELNAAIPGLFTSGNTANWRLFHEGVEQAAIIGFYNGEPTIEFYGRPIDTRESDTHMYYLIVDPSQTGIRGGRAHGGRQDTAQVSANYAATATKKERTSYASALANGDAENWFGDPILFSNPPFFSGSDKSITVSGIDFSAPTAVLTVRLQGYSNVAGTPNVEVKLNGTVVGNVTSSERLVPFSQQFTIQTSLLHEGSNTLHLTSQNGSFELFDTATVDYLRQYTSSQDSLLFTVPDQKSASVVGFSTPNVRAFLIGSDDTVTEIGRLAIQLNGGTYTANIPSTSHVGQAKMLAIENTKLLQSPAITANNPSNYRATQSLPADMIIISDSSPAFMTAASNWRNYRTSAAGGGFNVVVVDVADIMDEFNYGSFSAEAIKDFLQYIHDPSGGHWTTPVTGGMCYVLLLGDGSYDPRNYGGNGYNNMVPSMMINSISMETGSDEALADFNGDGLSEMAIGRVPARTDTFVNRVLAQTIAFEANPVNQDLNRGVLFAYDIPKDYYFDEISERLAAKLPVSVPVRYVHRGIDAHGDNLATDPNGKANLIAAMNSTYGTNGNYLVNYAGHGAAGVWGAYAGQGYSGFMETGFVNPNNPQVTNTNPSIYMMLTCLNGYFLNPGTANDPADSIAELLIKNPNGGGPAAWASTAETTAFLQEEMGKKFLEELSASNYTRMGDLIRSAKESIPAGTDVRFSWVYFGDPMLKVR